MAGTRQADATGLVPGAIMRAAARHPGRLAVAAGRHQLRYGELASRASELAGELRRCGVRQESVVAGVMPRGPAIAVAVLGTWLAGGAYLPIDPAGPAARTAHMLSGSQAGVVLRTGDAAIPALAPGQDVVELGPAGTHHARLGEANATGPGAAHFAGQDPLRPGDLAFATGPGTAHDAGQDPVRPGDLAFVIYTSGSTGQPKGVMVEHRSLLAMAVSHEQVIYRGAAGRLRRTALNSPAFTDTFFSDFAHLAAGRSLYVTSDAQRRDGEQLAQFIRDTGVEALDATPTQIKSVLAAGQAGTLEELRVLILGGEAIDSALWTRLRSLRRVRVFNLYGPTESTVDVTAADLAEHETPVIGTELPGCRVWVLDDDRKVVPDGAAGELWITGAQLARGYLSPAPADASRFSWLTLPGCPAPVRAYGTGDRGRRNPAGQLEFLGRTDDQVSIGGYRIELGEVESVLRTQPGVRDAAVGVHHHHGRPRIVAWFVPAPEAERDATGAVGARLAQALPHYMQPALVAVPAIPVGPSGKADIARLRAELAAGNVRPATAAGQAIADAAAAAAKPPGKAEAVAEILRAIWCDILGSPSVADGDDFFSLGGDSVTATNAVMASRSAVTPNIPIRTIFDDPTFGAFCAKVVRLASAQEG